MASELGRDDCLKIWDTSSGELTQTLWLCGRVLALRWADLAGSRAAVFVGASDGSVSIFYLKKVRSHIFNGYVTHGRLHVPG